jgi:hypothetical protein
MIWEPFLLAVAFGVVVSAAIYFVVIWPAVEPPDDGDDAAPRDPDPPETAPPGARGA